MDFASPHVYVKDDIDRVGRQASDEESVGSNDLEDDLEDFVAPVQSVQASVPAPSSAQGLMSRISSVFSSPENSVPPSYPRSAPREERRQSQEERRQPQEERRQRVRREPARKWKHKVGTNVVAVRLGTLGQQVALATGDPIFCQKCNVAFSCISSLTEGKSEESTQIWKCEFCQEEQSVVIDDEEKPSEESMDYILEPAPSLSLQRGVSGETTGLVIFCLDTSGSMCMTQELQGTMQLRGNTQIGRISRTTEDMRDQFLPGQRRDVTYVSRLQAVQAAVDAQLQSLESRYPSKKVMLIAFNREVVVIGDGRGTAHTISGDRLSNFDELIAQGESLSTALSPISETREVLSRKLFELEEGGATALGPAVTVAIACAKSSIGSRVVICTDGLANVGIGNLEGADQDEAIAQAAQNTYNQLAIMAAEAGITVDIIGIEGEGVICDFETLGVMAERTDGTVDKLDLTKLHHNFSNILAREVVATQVSVRFFLHCGLRLVDVDSEETSREKACMAVRDVGNVAEDTQITFEYAIHNRAERERLGVADLEQLPFQTQVFYTRLDGMKCVRVITKNKPVTKERSVIERNMDFSVLGSHAAQTAGKLASKGDYLNTRVHARAWANFMSRNAVDEERSAQVRTCFSNLRELDSEIGNELEMERSIGLDELSEERDVLKRRKAARSKNDKLSVNVHRMQKFSPVTRSEQSKK